MSDLKANNFTVKNPMETLSAISKALGILKGAGAKKVEVDSENYIIKAYTVDPGNGRKVICIRIEEP